MPRIDFSSPEFDYDATDPEGFRNGMLRFGTRVGAKTSGCSLYELPPGQAVCPYHYEYGEEEWLLVVSGRPTLRTPEGEAEIGPQEIVFFPTGPAGAHLVRNDTDSTVRVLLSNGIASSSPATPHSQPNSISAMNTITGSSARRRPTINGVTSWPSAYQVSPLPSWRVPPPRVSRSSTAR